MPTEQVDAFAVKRRGRGSGTCLKSGMGLHAL